MLYVEPLGGLCNRMRTIASFYPVAREAGRELTVVWLRDAGMNCPSARLFQLPEGVKVVEGPYVSKPGMRFRSAYRMLTHRAEGRRFDWTVENWQAKARLTPETVVALGDKSLYASSCYSLESRYEKYDYSIFRPAPDIQKLADEVMERFPANCVGVHIRRTDNAKSIEISRTADFVTRMRREIEADPEVGFFLATDSPEEERALEAEFPGRILTYESGRWAGQRGGHRRRLRGLPVPSPAPGRSTAATSAPFRAAPRRCTGSGLRSSRRAAILTSSPYENHTHAV